MGPAWKRSACLCCLLLSLLSLPAQPDFSYEPGAWTSLDGQVHEGLILNLRWVDNPERISFKASRTGAPQTIPAGQIAALRVGEHLRYERHAVQIDIPIETRSRVSTTRNPEWKSDTLLLRVMTEGPASLYVYQQGDLVRYFIRTGDEPPQQLIYKRYLTPENLIKQNQAFAGQLQVLLACEGALPPGGQPRYDGRYLKSAFQSYYACQGEAGRIYASQRPDNLHLRVMAGLRMSSAAFSYELGDQYLAEYGLRPTAALGAEAEYLLPFLGRRLALLAEFSVQHFSGTAGNSFWQDIQLRYRSAEFLSGLRCYPLSRPGIPYHPYLSAGYVLPRPLGDSRIFYAQGYEFPISPRGMACFAAGLRYKRFGGEFRYYLPQELLSAENTYWTTSLQSFSIAASFQLF